MIYLLDANVLIDASRDYYPHHRVPEFWEWPAHCGTNGKAKIANEIYEELTEKNKKKEDKDALSLWAEDNDVQKALLFAEDVDVELVRAVTQRGYAPDLTDNDVEKIGRDPFLIAYALVDVANRCVVTTEVSRPSKLRANRKVPDVCNVMGVKVCNTFQFVRALDFSTGWKR